jgi:hypothetical protein
LLSAEDQGFWSLASRSSPTGSTILELLEEMLLRSGPIPSSFCVASFVTAGQDLPHFQVWMDRKLSPIHRDRSAELRSEFHMACCCSSHESNAACDVIPSQGSRLPMELRRWSIQCSFHVSQVETAPVLASVLIPLHSHVFEYSSFLNNSCVCSTSRSK